jgi:glycosyltransferase involved in cell wall biosynthesis
MIIISSAKMGNGTFQAKFIPLSKLEQVEKIYVLRKSIGPEIDKVKYIILPSICSISLINMIVTPFILTYYALKLKANMILTYHFVPHAFFGFFASIVTGKPHIFAQTGGESQVLSRKPVLKQLTKLILKQAKFMLTPGSVSRDFWISTNQIKPEKIKILHSTIDTNRFSPNEVTYEYDFVFVGKLNSRKKVDEILKSCAKIKNRGNTFKICIIGEGEDKDDLMQFTRENEMTNYVDFVGFHKNVYPFLLKSKIFVMASTMEGLPVALMEAMSCEKLVITSDADNIPFLVKNRENGFIFKNGDYTTLSEMMIDALENFDTYAPIMKKARESIIDHHSYEAAMGKWTKIFESIRKS